MRPNRPEQSLSGDFLRMASESIIYMRDPLVRLTEEIDWVHLDESFVTDLVRVGQEVYHYGYF